MDIRAIQALQQEPACQHNHAGKAGCGKAKPGATQGGCFFDGARNALLPIADAAHIVHGPISCAGSSWDNRGSKSSGANLYRKGFTTDLSDMDIIMGRGEERLYYAIEQIVQRFSPPAIFIYTTCVPALHGDDVAAVARAASARWEIPVIAVDCAGYYGGKNLGNRLAGDVLLNQVIGMREPEPSTWKPANVRTTHDIGIIGEWNVGGEFWQILPFLDELGVRVLSTLTGDSRFAEVQTLHKAEANLLVCSKAFLNVARGLQEKYGIPFTECSFYGKQNTSDAFRKLASMLDDISLTHRVQALIEREELALEKSLQTYKPALAGKRVLIFSGGFKSWSLVAAMQELGMDVVATGTEKSTEEDKERILQLMGRDAITINDNDQQALIQAFHELNADLMIAGDRYIYPSLKSRIPFLDVDHVRHIAYTGYAGVLELARQLTRSLKNPVWQHVSASAPWDTGVETESQAKSVAKVA